jgi:tripartite-type tricarboxylate transporter receptor subunit TctC
MQSTLRFFIHKCNLISYYKKDTDMQRRSFIRSSALALTLLCSIPALHAQEAYPDKPVTVVVSFSAGGNNDIRARQLGIEVSKMLGKSIIVDNKPGASGNIGHSFLARSAPDGYTLGIGAMGPLAVNPWIYPKLPFDPQKDFTPIVLIEKAPLVLVTRTDKPFKSVSDVIAAAKAKPDALTIGHAGQGGAHHLSAELFKQQAGISMLPVPYKGGGPAANALLAGEVDMMFEQTYAALPSIKAGKTRALAVTSEKRLPSLPDVPTMTELGFPKVNVSNWLGLIGPKGMPPAIVKKLNESFNTALAMPDIRAKITDPGNEIGGGTPEQFATLIAAENKRWAQVVKAANIKVD